MGTEGKMEFRVLGEESESRLRLSMDLESLGPGIGTRCLFLLGLGKGFTPIIQVKGTRPKVTSMGMSKLGEVMGTEFNTDIILLNI